jgi:hypothetical protein
MKKLLLVAWAFCSFPAVAQVSRACTQNEKWNVLPLNKEWGQRFLAFTKSQITPVEGMAFAHRLKVEAADRLEEFFSEYWLAQGLYKSGHFPLAEMGFERILSRLPNAQEYQALREGSFECLAEIHHRVPSRHLNKNLYSSLTHLRTGPIKDYWSFRWAIEQNSLSNGLKMSSKESPFVPLLKALQYYNAEDWAKSAEAIDDFFDKKIVPKYIQSQLNHWRMMAARMNYTAARFAKAESYWSAVDRRSNELVQALTEVSWSQLRSGKQNDAIGTALSLQTGWLQNTYSPEGLMVMSMAFNETCHYPEAMRASELLKQQYNPVYQWLLKHQKVSDNELYGKLVLALKKESDVPYRLSSEWIRSPNFISRQEEINALLKMGDRNKELVALGAQKQRQRVVELLKLVKEIKKDVEGVHKLEPDRAQMPDWVEQKLAGLRSKLLEYEALRGFAPMWQAAEKANANLSRQRRQVLVTEIQKHIRRTNQRVLSQIRDIYDNLKFVEVEIYQGATQDMIISHSHPEYDKKIAALKESRGYGLKSNELNWGQISTEELGRSEIWEDELGGFKANLPNKCEKVRLARGLAND